MLNREELIRKINKAKEQIAKHQERENTGFVTPINNMTPSQFDQKQDDRDIGDSIMGDFERIDS